MCGICGFTGLDDKPLLRSMTALLTHRGPDSDGFHFGSSASLGMRRLAIIDVPGGGQPIYSEDGKIAVVFNGEIYNHRELRRELQSRGHVFKTSADTEVIVHLYEEMGGRCAERLEGMFAFAVADERTGILVLARDPVGIKPLYYASAPNGGLIFASEMKSLLLAPFLRREIDPAALDAYLSYLYVPEPLSIFRGISQLAPGHLVVHDGRRGKTAVKKYWELRPSPSQLKSAREREEALCELLATTVSRHLMSDVPLGIFLSGGLDSGAIAAFMARAGVIPRTYSIGFEGSEEGSYDELASAALTAARCGAQHHEIRVSPDIAGLMETLVWHLDEPHADSSAIVTYLVSKHASCDLKVALTGIGGDEVFGGYPRYAAISLHPMARRIPRGALKAFRGCAEFFTESGESRDWVNWAQRFSRGAGREEFDCYDSWLRTADDDALSRLYSDDWKAAHATMPVCRRAQERRSIYFASPSENPADRASFMDLQTYLPGDLLSMADKMSMACSLELRVPFCDKAVVEFMFSLPPSERANPFGLKRLLRRVLKPMLPPQVLAKRKQGFMIPLAPWLKGPLKPLAEDLLAPELIRRRGYFNADAVASLWAEHRSGVRNRADILWALMMFEMWHRLYADGKFPDKSF